MKKGIERKEFKGERRKVKNKGILRSNWILVIILILFVMAGIVFYKRGDVLYAPSSSCSGFISTDYDSDGINTIKYDSYCKMTPGDNCPTIYNPTQNNKYCNPFYGQVLTDDPDKDFIPTALKYSSALGFYVGEVSGQGSVFTNIKARAVSVRIGLTGTPTSRVLTSTEISKLASQGTTPSPSPSPTGSVSPSPSP